MSHRRRLAVFASSLALSFTCPSALAATSEPANAPTLDGHNASPVPQRSKLPIAASDDLAVQSLRRRIIGLEKARLDNGLRVVMDSQPDAPTVAVCVTYDVGSRNEGPLQSGFAHLFEHMMFQGSRHVLKGKHFQMIASRGGTLNGTTSADRTNYFETLPANELKLALWLEADRMRWLDVSEENLNNQRAVVKEEYRMRYENAPYRLAQIELDRNVFAGYLPYAHPTIGSLADLDRASIDWVRDFHNSYYAPNNAVLTITGGFEPDEAMRWIHEYFDSAESHSIAHFVPPDATPRPTSEVRLEVADKNAKTPALLMGWRIAPHSHPDHAALELLGRVLADGESSLLYDLLVRQLAIARNVAAYSYDRAGPDALVIHVEMTQNARFDRVESTTQRILDLLATKGPTLAQLDRAIQRAKSSLLIDLQSNQSRATTFGEYEVLFGDARLVVADLEQLLAVSPKRVQQVMSQYITTTSRTLVRVVPSEQHAPHREDGRP